MCNRGLVAARHGLLCCEVKLVVIAVLRPLDTHTLSDPANPELTTSSAVCILCSELLNRYSYLIRMVSIFLYTMAVELRQHCNSRLMLYTVVRRVLEFLLHVCVNIYVYIFTHCSVQMITAGLIHGICCYTLIFFPMTVSPAVVNAAHYKVNICTIYFDQVRWTAK